MIAPQIIVTPPAPSLARRIALAAAAGVVLTAALIGSTVLMPALAPASQSRHCGEYTGCVSTLFLAWDPGRWIALAAAWPLLHLLRLHPSWQIALAAAAYLVAIWQAALAIMSADAGAGLALVLFSGLIAYPAAAWVTMPHVSVRTRVLTAGAALGLFGLASLLVQ
ncbi:hypothetical protein ACIBIZ_45090 [Nonomuraea spiralis]|uniref:hypothetical protein n=1 Tax=Nonomuraea spiralis TaxID=46182 RepID=UPI00378B0B05